jgi:hypothetical protein
MPETDPHQDRSTTTESDFSKPLTIRRSIGAGGGDRAIKLRLLSLFGLLLLVVVAMKEAGKPEHWMWLGFDSPRSLTRIPNSDLDGNAIVIEQDALTDPSATNDGRVGGELGYMPDRIANRFPHTDQAESDSSKMGKRFDPQQSAVAVDFWRSAFSQLDVQQQAAFYQLMRRVGASRIGLPENDLPFDAAIKHIGRLHAVYQTQTLSDLAVMSQSDRKTELTQQLFAFDQSWKDSVLPTLKASARGVDFTISDQSTINSVRSIIDPIVFQNVEDLTGMGNPRDKLAWLASWDRAIADGGNHSECDSLESPVQVSSLQLNGQPAAFRGLEIEILGTALTIRRKTLSQTLLQVDRYYEFWIDPQDAVGEGLVCVYAAELPSGFSEHVGDVSEQFQTIELPVQVKGRFFKIRSYQDAGGAVSHCPVIVAHSFVADFDSNPVSASGRWQPSAMMWGAFLSGSLVAAIGIACLVYRSTSSGTKPKPRLANAKKRVNRSLQALAEDESVMTDAQRVSRLNEVLDEEYS